MRQDVWSIFLMFFFQTVSPFWVIDILNTDPQQFFNTFKEKCIVPEDVHTQDRRLFGLSPQPAGKFKFSLRFPLKILAFRIPLSSKFLMTFLGVGVVIFWNHSPPLPKRSYPNHPKN